MFMTFPSHCCEPLPLNWREYSLDCNFAVVNFPDRFCRFGLASTEIGGCLNGEGCCLDGEGGCLDGEGGCLDGEGGCLDGE